MMHSGESVHAHVVSPLTGKADVACQDSAQCIAEGHRGDTSQASMHASAYTDQMHKYLTALQQAMSQMFKHSHASSTIQVGSFHVPCYTTYSPGPLTTFAEVLRNSKSNYLSFMLSYVDILGAIHQYSSLPCLLLSSRLLPAIHSRTEPYRPFSGMFAAMSM